MKFEIKVKMGGKGISPLIATVLLIAFTVAVAGIVSIWLTGFTTTSTESVGEHAEKQLYCAYGGISVSDLAYCSAHSNLTGIITNTQLVDIGNITIQIIYTNASSEKIYLTQNGSKSSVASTMSLEPREQASFDVPIGGSNYNKIHVYTNCSNVFDDATSADVTTATC